MTVMEQSYYHFLRRILAYREYASHIGLFSAQQPAEIALSFSASDSIAGSNKRGISRAGY